MLIVVQKVNSRGIFLSIITLILISFFLTRVEAQSNITPGREIRQTPGIETAFPARATPNTEQDITDLNYWLDTLPYDQDKTAAGFVVYPKQGVIIPLVRPDTNDQQKIQVGELFNHYKYLEGGALHYVGNAPDHGIGNMVLAVHSSYKKTDPGRYKTAGQVAPYSVVGDKVFVYLADDTATYTLYEYTIQHSKEIPETQVSILDQQVTENTLTLFTCYPIGTTEARWVNTAVLTKIIPTNEWKGIQTHGSAPEKENIKTQSKKQKNNNQQADKKTTATTSFTTQSAIKTTEKIENTRKISTTKTTTSKPNSSTTSEPSENPELIKPTFKERVLYRPIVYRTAIKLVSTVGFKRSNLQKLIDLLDQKVTTLSGDETKTEKNKKLIVVFLLIRELVEGFMQ